MKHLKDTEGAVDSPASYPPLYLPVDTVRGIEYAIIPRGMPEVYFEHMIETLHFHAKHHPEFLSRTVKASGQGEIIGTCGHKLGEDDGENGGGLEAITLGNDCDAQGPYRTTVTEVVCRKCFDSMKKQNILLTQAEADLWINNGEIPERMAIQDTLNKNTNEK